MIIILNQKSCTTLFVSPSWSCIFATSFPFLRIDNKHFFMSYVQHVTKNRYNPGSGTTNSPDWNFKTWKYIKNWITQTSIFKVINCNFMNLFWYLWTHGISNIYGACAKRYVIFAAINIVVLKLDIKISLSMYNKNIFTEGYYKYSRY